MVALLGQRDAFLKIIESAFDCEILVRGNEITISGPRRTRPNTSARMFEELLTLLEKGHELTDSVRRPDDRDDQGRQRRRRRPATPSEVLGDTLLTARGKGIDAEDDRAEALRRRDPLVAP